jgi:uncharacterized protein
VDDWRQRRVAAPTMARLGSIRRLVSRFMFTMTLLLAALYAYIAWRLADGALARALLALPFVLIWLVPALYWVGNREGRTRLDDWLHAAGYVSMGWLNFAVLLALTRDALQLASAISPRFAGAQAMLAQDGGAMALAGSFVALALGLFWGLRGPSVAEIEIRVPGLHRGLDGVRIVQISDLHVGPVIGRRYVERAVELARSLSPDLYALTGDFVDGTVERLAPHVEPLRALAISGRAFFVTGNHEYYAGATPWLAHLRRLGLRVLENEHVIIPRDGARLLVAGVNDVTARRFGVAPPDPQRALRQGSGPAAGDTAADFRLLLAHHPKLAASAAQAGFDLQLSGHTHAGQFFPWTIAVRRLHAPHVAGLSREGRMWVYVSAGTGSWGPPVRFGTRTEVTLLRLVRAA